MTNATNAITPSTTALAYADRKAGALAKLDALRAAIESHGTVPEETHWGHVGDLAYVDSQLTETLEFLAGEEAFR